MPALVLALPLSAPSGLRMAVRLAVLIDRGHRELPIRGMGMGLGGAGGGQEGKLYISGLPYTVDEDALKAVFIVFGDITDLKILK